MSLTPLHFVSQVLSYAANRQVKADLNHHEKSDCRLFTARLVKPVVSSKTGSKPSKLTAYDWKAVPKKVRQPVARVPAVGRQELRARRYSGLLQPEV
jgi:hypothetical protein